MRYDKITVIPIHARARVHFIYYYLNGTIQFDLMAVVIDFATYLAPQLLRNVSIFNVVWRRKRK